MKMTKLTSIIEELQNETIICLDCETEGINPLKHKVILLQLGTLSGDQYLIDCRDFDITELQTLLEDPNKTFVGHNIKFDYNMLKQYNIVLSNVYDTMIVDQVIHNGKYDQDEIRKNKRYSLAGVYKHYFNKTIEKTVRNEFPSLKERNFTDNQILYGANDVKYPLEIKVKQEELIKKYDLEVKVRLENKVVLPIGDMEYNGIKVDTVKFLSLVDKYKIRSKQTEQLLDEYLINKNPKYKKQAFQLDLFGGREARLTDVQWNSSQQVLDILEKEFNIIPKDKHGKVSSGANAFSILDYSAYDKILDLILQYREELKIIDSFGEEYIKNSVYKDGRIHTQFNQIVETGRMSSRKPNMQQLPAGEHRDCFIAEPGHKLSCADFSSQESVIMANLANDESFIEYFKQDGNDIHSYVATKLFTAMFGKEFIVTKDNENKEYRHKGKTLNFGISFGMSAYTLSKTLHITVEEAQEIIDSFFKAFPALKNFFAQSRKFGVQNGYIRTNDIIKGIRWFKDHDKLKTLEGIEKLKLQGSIERKSQNTKIQGRWP